MNLPMLLLMIYLQENSINRPKVLSLARQAVVEAKMHQIYFRSMLWHGRRWGSLQCFPRPFSWLWRGVPYLFPTPLDTCGVSMDWRQGLLGPCGS